MNIATKLRELADEIESQDTPDIRPIGELPVGTEIDEHDRKTGTRMFVEPPSGGRVGVADRWGYHVQSFPPDEPVRVIAYPEGYRADGTPEPNEDVVRTLESAGCVDPETTQFLVTPKLVDGRSARSVIDELKKSKPHLFQKPEPTAMEQLPEAVREFLEDRNYYSGKSHPDINDSDDREALARVILDNAAEIFAAGEPAERYVAETDNEDTMFTIEPTRYPENGPVYIEELQVWIPDREVGAVARRMVAFQLAARKNAQGDAS